MAPVVAQRLEVSVIPRQEILDLAAEFGLAANVVEKDYALGWMLAGFGQHPAIRDTWLFKGGTCLKKCFFETYRFSEDLDFTVVDAMQLEGDFLSKLFQDVADWVYEQTGLVMPPEARKVDVYTNSRGGKSAEGRIGYRGPLGRAGDTPRIKIDLTSDERVVLDPDRRQIHHPYSDCPAEGLHVTTYCFEEVFAEKVRALAERLRPRDLYDVVHLYRRHELQPDRTEVIETLRSKCEFKRIAVPTLESLQNSPLLQELQVSWEQMLGHQLPQLPPFDDFWRELPQVFAWLIEAEEVEELPAMVIPAAGALDMQWRPPVMAASWRSFGTSAPLEVVRFAAANRLIVDLEYRDEAGRKSTRKIEPYSLRRSQAGNILLFATKSDTGEARSYRLDRIVSAGATRESFVPKFQIEITGTGLMPMPTIQRPLKSPVRNLRSTPSRRKSTASSFPTGQTKYVFRCPVCSKTFKSTSYDASLNQHKGKNGWPCLGSFGVYVRTEY
jgi:predicted nucleotidyltransferase component of viral defense system